jgi:hypothetical protein
VNERFAVEIGANDDGTAVKPAFARPMADEKKQTAPERDQTQQSEDEEAA